MANTRFDTANARLINQANATATADALLADIASDWLRQKRRRRILTWIFRFLVIALLLAIAGSLLFPLFNREPVSDEPYTATVSLTGAVFEEGEASFESLRTRLAAALEDERSAGVLLLIDSPGGSPVQAGLMFDEIVRLRQEHPDKPVHAVVGDLAASAGYYIAAAADNIYANKASLIGSIGVRLDSFGAVDAIERLGLERRLLTAGEHKGLLDPFLPVDETGEAHLQSVLESVHQQFIDAVVTGRGERLADDPKLFSGLIWSGEQAVELGLIDDLKNRYAVAEEVIGASELRAYEPDQTLLERLSDEIGASITELLLPQLRWR